jgi:hypothetical protein
MSEAARAIVEELKAAFPQTREGRFAPMANSAQGDEPVRVAAAFSGKQDWTKFPAEWLDLVPDGLASALSFLSDEAIRFYIPAYLAADLIGELHRVDPTFELVNGFEAMSCGRRIHPRGEETWTDFARARWDDLSRRQAAAVAATSRGGWNETEWTSGNRSWRRWRHIGMPGPRAWSRTSRTGQGRPA